LKSDDSVSVSETLHQRFPFVNSFPKKHVPAAKMHARTISKIPSHTGIPHKFEQQAACDARQPAGYRLNISRRTFAARRKN